MSPERCHERLYDDGVLLWVSVNVTIGRSQSSDLGCGKLLQRPHRASS